MNTEKPAHYRENHCKTRKSKEMLVNRKKKIILRRNIRIANKENQFPPRSLRLKFVATKRKSSPPCIREKWWCQGGIPYRVTTTEQPKNVLYKQCIHRSNQLQICFAKALNMFRRYFQYHCFLRRTYFVDYTIDAMNEVDFILIVQTAAETLRNEDLPDNTIRQKLPCFRFSVRMVGKSD